MSLLARFTKPKTPDDSWHPADGVYPSLFDLGAHAAALDAKGGIYALWHLGVRPQWLWIGAGADLRECLIDAAGALASSPLRGNGGIYAAWAFMAAPRWPGVVHHLRGRLEPIVQDIILPGDALWETVPVPVVFPLPPGTTER